MMEKILQMIFSAMVWQKLVICPTSYTEPKGNSIKYTKHDPREFVPFEYSEVTLENIECVCIVHYRENLTACDILASEQGLFYSLLDQTPQSHLCSLYNVRAWKAYPFRNVRIRSISKLATTHTKTKCRRVLFHKMLYLQSAQQKI